MSISSPYKKDRLFQHLKNFTNSVDNNYIESYYYLINSVDYDENSKPIKVSITILLDVYEWLKNGKCHQLNLDLESDLSAEQKSHIKIYEKLR